jgi:hypothetical protein
MTCAAPDCDTCGSLDSPADPNPGVSEERLAEIKALHQAGSLVDHCDSLLRKGRP